MEGDSVGAEMPVIADGDGEQESEVWVLSASANCCGIGK